MLSLMSNLSLYGLASDRAWTPAPESLAPIFWRPYPTVGWEPLPIVIVIGLGNCTTAPMPFVPRVAKNFDGPELLACGHQTNTDHIFLVHLTSSTRPLALEIK